VELPKQADELTALGQVQIFGGNTELTNDQEIMNIFPTLEHYRYDLMPKCGNLLLDRYKD